MIVMMTLIKDEERAIEIINNALIDFFYWEGIAYIVTSVKADPNFTIEERETEKSEKLLNKDINGIREDSK